MNILMASDLHLSPRRPLCRVDENWMDFQMQRLADIGKICKERECDVLLLAGDVFDYPRVDEQTTTMFLRFLNTLQLPTVVIAGNHDLPWHQTSKMEQSAMGVVDGATCMTDRMYVVKNGTIGFGTKWGLDKPLTVSALSFDEQFVDNEGDGDVVMVHTFAVADEADKPPFHPSVTARELAEMYPDAELIVVGDNHDGWSRDIGKQTVVNCGCTMRTRANEMNYTPSVWIWDGRGVERIPLPDDSVNMDVSYIEQASERELHENQYGKMLDELKEGMEVSYDYVEALSSYIRENRNRIGHNVADVLEDVLAKVKATQRS